MSETVIIREVPARRRAAGAAFVLPAPSTLLARSTVQGVLAALRARVPLLVCWTLAGAVLWPLTLVGLAVVAPPTRSMIEGIRPTETQLAAWYVEAAAGAGLAAGLVQWLLVRPTLRRAGWWVPATAAGWALGMLAATRGATALSAWIAARFPETRVMFATPQWERYVVLGLIGTALGTALGLAQWAVLLRTLPRAYVWVAMSAVAWTAGTLCLPLIPRLPADLIRTDRYTGGMETTLPGLALAGAAYGLLTAFALVLLLRESAPQPLET